MDTERKNKPTIYSKFLKRFLDIIFCLLLSIILIIPEIIIAILIKFTSKGPVIFKQVRIGLDSKPFVIYKFRTMSEDAPHELATAETKDVAQYIDGIGNFLRKTSMDELPQLLNVLKGDMSIIGPRPLIVSEKDINRRRHALGIDTIFPGITGLAQVMGRDMLDDNEKIKYDLTYYQNVSFRLDFKIMCLTLQKVIQHKDIKN